jgi:divalent metal cation (Fe/Co/Zn/Cd) transporter
MEKKIYLNKIQKIAFISLFFNMAYSGYHILFGVITRSWWLFTIGIYFAILSIIRFTVLKSKGKGRFIIQFTGSMLMVLSLPLVGTVVLAFLKDRGSVFHEIVMITIALYAFTKITIATINLIKSRCSQSAKHIALRYISFADAFVSMFSLQRSMLVSFGAMTETSIRIMNAATGGAVCCIVFLLGLQLMHHKKS